MIKELETVPDNQIVINGEPYSANGYFQYHRQRIDATLNKLREIGARRLVELGGHPWVMTSAFIDAPEFELCASVSAEEATDWPDDIGVTATRQRIRTPRGAEASFVNYSANVERTLFDIQERPDTVVACEIIEHLTRSPHVMLLNINRWLPVGGKLFMTTPNGAQFSNPLRRQTPTPAYRCNTYERHAYLFTMAGLVDLVRLCGFKIVEAGYWDVVERRGPSSLYGLLAKLPSSYFREKFKKTLYVVAEKEKDVASLERCPSVYDPRGNWEFVSRDASGRAG